MRGEDGVVGKGKLVGAPRFQVVKIGRFTRDKWLMGLSVVSMLLLPLNCLLQLLRVDLQSLPRTSLSSYENAGAQLGAVQFLQVYSLYFAYNLKTV